MDWTLFATFLAACGAAATTGAMFKPGEWYAELKKPCWIPPRWVFPVAWTTLYLLMTLAAARVAVLPGNGQALAFWALQIALNTLWTPVFFGLHRMRAAMVVMVLLWLAVAGDDVEVLSGRLVCGAAVRAVSGLGHHRIGVEYQRDPDESRDQGLRVFCKRGPFSGPFGPAERHCHGTAARPRRDDLGQCPKFGHVVFSF